MCVCAKPLQCGGPQHYRGQAHRGPHWPCSCGTGGRRQRNSGVARTCIRRVVIVNIGGRIKQLNRQAEVLFGHSRDELVGQPVETLMPERFRQARASNRAASRALASTRWSSLSCSTGTRTASSSRSRSGSSLSEGELLIAGTIHDITQRKSSRDPSPAVVRRAREARPRPNQPSSLA